MNTRLVRGLQGMGKRDSKRIAYQYKLKALVNQILRRMAADRSDQVSRNQMLSKARSIER